MKSLVQALPLRWIKMRLVRLNVFCEYANVVCVRIFLVCVSGVMFFVRIRGCVSDRQKIVSECCGLKTHTAAQINMQLHFFRAKAKISILFNLDKKLIFDAFSKFLSINILHRVSRGSKDSSFHFIKW